MQAPVVQLRPATALDRELVYEWARDPLVRAASFSTEPISWETHCAWFGESLGGARSLFVIEADGVPVGLARLDPRESNSAEVGILLSERGRGRRLSLAALDALMQIAVGNGLGSLIARVREDNPRSRRLFERAGFGLRCRETVRGIGAVRYDFDCEGRIMGRVDGGD